MNTHRDGFRVRPAWVRHRRFLILAALALLLLLISGAAPARADGLRIGYHDGKWAVSARFTSSRAAWCAPSPGWQWSFRCAPGLVTRPYCYPASYHTGYPHGAWYYNTWYNDDYAYQGDVTDYYGLRLNRAPLEEPAATSAPSAAAAAADTAPPPPPAEAVSNLDPDAELARVLEEFSSQRTPLVLHNEAGEEEAGLPLNPRVQVPESLPYLANLPEVEITTAMPRVR